MAPAAEADSRTPLGSRQVKLRCTCGSNAPVALEHEHGRCSKTKAKRHGDLGLLLRNHGGILCSAISLPVNAYNSNPFTTDSSNQQMTGRRAFYS
jgi:hypothetical protein